jgi:hypothetical protein
MVAHLGFKLKNSLFVWCLIQAKIGIYMYCSIVVGYFTVFCY